MDSGCQKIRTVKYRREELKKIQPCIRKIQLIVILSLVYAVPPALVFAAIQTAEVSAVPDLKLNASDILYSPEQPTVGQPVNIMALIYNIGSATATNVTVDFYIDGTFIVHNELIEIALDSMKSVSINFIFLYAGSHNVTVILDANNTITELNETNNQATNYITVAVPLTPPPAIGGGGGGGGGLPWLTPRDTTPPVISNVTVVLDSSITITWDTNEVSDSLVKYGVISGQYIVEKSDPQYVLNHSIALEAITEYGPYYFVVMSTDPSGNVAQSAEHIFILILSGTELPTKGGSTVIIFPAPPSRPKNLWAIALLVIIAAFIISFLIYKRYRVKLKRRIEEFIKKGKNKVATKQEMDGLQEIKANVISGVKVGKESKEKETDLSTSDSEQITSHDKK
ncbi:MAG: hypothetical protein EFT35_03335 [Methanophagales archaeon ANME-1-THS]|nr:MAG: hypothetical protein EFT35_03335 [Methanophagales archaeon ANME-1-THS]